MAKFWEAMNESKFYFSRYIFFSSWLVWDRNQGYWAFCSAQTAQFLCSLILLEKTGAKRFLSYYIYCDCCENQVFLFTHHPLCFHSFSMHYISKKNNNEFILSFFFVFLQLWKSEFEISKSARICVCIISTFWAILPKIVMPKVLLIKSSFYETESRFGQWDNLESMNYS